MTRVRHLESGLTKKMMSADLKIVQTVKENDKLRQKLLKICTALENEKVRQSNLEKILSSIKEQSTVVTSLQQSLSDVKSNVLQLKSTQSSEEILLRNHSPPLKGGVGSGRNIKFVRSTSTNSGGSVVRTSSPVAVATRSDQLRERNEELNKGVKIRSPSHTHTHTHTYTHSHTHTTQTNTHTRTHTQLFTNNKKLSPLLKLV